MILLISLWVHEGNAESLLPPEPVAVMGVDRHMISLNGAWMFAPDPLTEFRMEVDTSEGWYPIVVPGECVTQGFYIEHNREFAYRRTISIPSDFRNKTILIRFDGVYSYARVWINGVYIRDHHGGFTSWDCDITDHVKPGKDVVVTVAITDYDDEISYGSGYAKHPIGGILRDVTLMALSHDHIGSLHIKTDLDPAYRDASLNIGLSLEFQKADKATVQFVLTNPSGTKIPMEPSSITLTKDTPSLEIHITVENPLKWDAEHPHLYTLETKLTIGRKTVQEFRNNVGFRKVKVRRNKLFVNGREVKLRGVNRHDVHPLYGRSTTKELDRLDVERCREANVNFIRTSHYPPSKAFLDFCDLYGMYVEEETAVCFVNTHRSPGYSEISATQDNPEYFERYMGQVHEMMERDGNHPSVIMWSVGNENTWGINFQKTFDRVKEADASRPVIFSYPATVPDGTVCYDIISSHYPEFTGKLDGDAHQIGSEDFASTSMPRLNDEWAHVACYNLETLRRDPNVRNNWGESIERFWRSLFDADGGLGGAIWSMTDEVFALPDSCVGYGEWGIIDGWRRRKPEFWHTKKAYSPVRLETTVITDFSAGNPINIPVYNRFDHTNLNELSIQWEAHGTSGTLTAQNIKPHERGVITLPAHPWAKGDSVSVRFVDTNNDIVDEYLIRLGRQSITFPEKPAERMQIRDNQDALTITGQNFSVTFNTSTGMITSGSIGDDTIIESGPYLYLVTWEDTGQWGPKKLVQLDETTWQLNKMTFHPGKNHVQFMFNGAYDSLEADFRVTVNSNGLLNIEYSTGSLPSTVREIGIGFKVNDTIENISWMRDAQWSVYPDTHIGRPSGATMKRSASGAIDYRTEPQHPWSQDMTNHYLFGMSGHNKGYSGATNDFRSCKENIWYYTLHHRHSQAMLRVESDTTESARTEVAPDGSMNLYIINQMSYTNLDWGNYEKQVQVTPAYRDSVKVRLTDKNTVQVQYE